MPRLRKVLDTSILIRAWQRSRGTLRGPIEQDDVVEWAGRLIDLFGSDAIVTPVFIEFVAGVQDAPELRIAHAFLSRFRIIDEVESCRRLGGSARLAERVPRDRRPRQLGDCLIRAIAMRLNHDVETHDTGFPRRRPGR